MLQRAAISFLSFVVAFPSAVAAQRERGEVRVEVHDPQGATVAGEGELVSELNQVRREFRVGADGKSVVQGLPFGRYHASFRAQGFAEWSGMLEIRSEVPLIFAITLGVAPVTTQVKVSDS